MQYSNGDRVLIGIFSYNEGENLRNMYNQVSTQSQDMNREIVLMDQSDDDQSLSVVNEILSSGVRNLWAGSTVRGKVHSMNRLFQYFLDSKCETLLHFDADHILSGNAVVSLVKQIHEGSDVATLLNKPQRPEKFFQRAIGVMSLPATLGREAGSFSLPLVGHNGAYNRRAVELMGRIPTDGVDEESYVLYKVLTNNLRFIIARDAVSYYALPSDLGEYLISVKRMVARINAFENWKSMHKFPETGLNTFRIVYSRPPISLVIRSMLSDPLPSFIIPYIYIRRAIAINAAGIYTSDTWTTIEGTKVLKQNG